MSASSLMTKPVTLMEPVVGADDSFGQPTITLTAHATVCHYRRIYSDDASGMSIIPTDTLEIYLPAGTVIDGDWKVVLDGESYEVMGDIQKRWNPRQERVEFLSALLRRAGL